MNTSSIVTYTIFKDHSSVEIYVDGMLVIVNSATYRKKNTIWLNWHAKSKIVCLIDVESKVVRLG